MSRGVTGACLLNSLICFDHYHSTRFGSARHIAFGYALGPFWLKRTVSGGAVSRPLTSMPLSSPGPGTAVTSAAVVTVCMPDNTVERALHV